MSRQNRAAPPGPAGVVEFGDGDVPVEAGCDEADEPVGIAYLGWRVTEGGADGPDASPGGNRSSGVASVDEVGELVGRCLGARVAVAVA